MAINMKGLNDNTGNGYGYSSASGGDGRKKENPFIGILNGNIARKIQNNVVSYLSKNSTPALVSRYINQQDSAVTQPTQADTWSNEPQMSRTARQSKVKPYLELPTRPTAQTTNKAAPVITPRPATNTPITGVPMDIGITGASKTVSKDGKVLYSDTPAIALPPRPQAGGIKNVGGTTPQERYAMQQAPDYTSQLQMEEAAAAKTNAQTLAALSGQGGMNPELQDQLNRTLQTYNSGMAADSAAGNARAKIAGKQIEDLLSNQNQATGSQLKASEMAQSGNQFYQKLAEEQRQADQRTNLDQQELQAKQPYLDSEIALNNAQTVAALTPRPQKPEEWKLTQDENGKPIQVSDSGIMRPVKESPEMTATKNKAAFDADMKRLYDPEDPTFSGLSDVEKNNYRNELAKRYGVKL